MKCGDGSGDVETFNVTIINIFLSLSSPFTLPLSHTFPLLLSLRISVFSSHQNFEVLKAIESEYRQESKYLDRHSLSLAFLKLLSLLFSRTDPSLLSSSSERRGVEKAIDFVSVLKFAESLFSVFHDLRCEREWDRWKLCKFCFHIFRAVITCYVPKYDLLKGGNRLAEPYSAGLYLMSQFLTYDTPLLLRLKYVLMTAAGGGPLDPNHMDEADADSSNRGLPLERDGEWGLMYEEAVAACLSLICAILLKQSDHFDVVRRADNPPRSFKPFHSHLLSFIGFVTAFVNYQFNDGICLDVLRILDYVSVHTASEDLVRQIPNQKGFFENFQMRLLVEDASSDPDSSLEECDDIHAERMVRSAAVRLLLNSLSLRGLNLSLFLLGFRRNSNEPNVYVLCDYRALDVIIVLATSAASSSSSSSSSPSPRTNLSTMCLDLLVRLCSTPYASSAVLERLRTVKDFYPLMDTFHTITESIPSTITTIGNTSLSSPTLLPTLYSLIRDMKQMAYYWRIVASEMYFGLCFFRIFF
jgi:hypothetical protein